MNFLLGGGGIWTQATAEQNNRQLVRYAQFHCLDLDLWIANFKISLKILSRWLWLHCNASTGEDLHVVLALPEAQRCGLLHTFLSFLLRPASLRVSSLLWIEVFLPSTSILLNAPPWRKIWFTPHLFGNQPTEQPNTYKSLVFHLTEFITRKTLVKLRISSHKLRIETRRYNSIPRDERLRSLCNCYWINEDETILLIYLFTFAT